MSDFANRLPRTELLTEKEENRLFRRLRRLTARRKPSEDDLTELGNLHKKLVLQYCRWAAALADQTARGRMCGNEASSIGVQALHKLLPRFLPGTGVRFVAFARQRIIGEVLSEIRRKNRREAGMIPFDSITGQGSGNRDDEAQYRPTLSNPCDSDLVHEGDQGQQVDYALVRALVSELPDQMRRAVELSYFQGLNSREVGERMGVSRQRVHQVLIEAERELRSKLSRDKHVETGQDPGHAH